MTTGQTANLILNRFYNNIRDFNKWLKENNDVYANSGVAKTRLLDFYQIDMTELPLINVKPTAMTNDKRTVGRQGRSSIFYEIDVVLLFNEDQQTNSAGIKLADHCEIFYLAAIQNSSKLWSGIGSPSKCLIGDGTFALDRKLNKVNNEVLFLNSFAFTATIEKDIQIVSG